MIFSGAEKSCPRKRRDPPAHINGAGLLQRVRNHEQQKGCCLLDNILLLFGDTLIPWLVRLKARRIIQAGSDLRMSLTQPPSQSRVSH